MIPVVLEKFKKRINPNGFEKLIGLYWGSMADELLICRQIVYL